LFDWFSVEDRDIVTWNSLIGDFAYNGMGDSVSALSRECCRVELG